MEELATQQKKLRNDIESTSDTNIKNTLKKERKTIEKKIRKILREREEDKINKQLESIENTKDDSRKMFHAIKELSRQDGNKKLLIDGEMGQTSNPKQQVKIVTAFFKEQFSKNAEKID